MAYSLDLRTRVLAAVDGGLSRTQAAARYQVGRASIAKWVKLRRETGALTVRQPPGRPRMIGVADREALRAQLSAQPAATLEAHVARWVARHPSQHLSRATMGLAILRLDWTRKKSRSMSVNKTPPAVRLSKHGSRRGRPRTS
ncbi:MAG: IS630 transposase-related protein [Chloroflexi bacterium]|nr:IS630 transposase-related protein [Chloroflexota bacterium]